MTGVHAISKKLSFGTAERRKPPRRLCGVFESGSEALIKFVKSLWGIEARRTGVRTLVVMLAASWRRGRLQPSTMRRWRGRRTRASSCRAMRASTKRRVPSPTRPRRCAKRRRRRPGRRPRRGARGAPGLGAHRAAALRPCDRRSSGSIVCCSTPTSTASSPSRRPSCWPSATRLTSSRRSWPAPASPCRASAPSTPLLRTGFRGAGEPAPEASFRCRYVRALAVDIAQIAAETHAEWAGDYRQQWLRRRQQQGLLVGEGNHAGAVPRLCDGNRGDPPAAPRAAACAAKPRLGGPRRPCYRTAGSGLPFILAAIEGARDILGTSGFLAADLAGNDKERSAIAILGSVATDLGFALRAGEAARDGARPLADDKARERLAPMLLSLKNAEERDAPRSATSPGRRSASTRSTAIERGAASPRSPPSSSPGTCPTCRPPAACPSPSACA